MINRLLQFPSSTGGVTATPSLPPRGPESSSTQGLSQGPVWRGWDGPGGMGHERCSRSLPCHRGIQPWSGWHLFEVKSLSEIKNLRKPLPGHILTGGCAEPRGSLSFSFPK